MTTPVIPQSFDVQIPHSLVNLMIHTHDLNPDNFTTHPMLNAEGEEIGYVAVYQSDDTKSTLMYTVADANYSTIPIDLQQLLNYEVVDDDNLVRSINLFSMHPDTDVIKQVAYLTQFYINSDYEVRILPWEDLQPKMAPDLPVEAINGGVYPIIHMLNHVDREVVVIMVSPYLN